MTIQASTSYHSNDYYAYLNLDSSASVSDIKRNYHQLALQWHPDKHSEGVERSNAKEIFQRIAEAKNVLTDASARPKYDRVWLQKFSRTRRVVPNWALDAGRPRTKSSSSITTSSSFSGRGVLEELNTVQDESIWNVPEEECSMDAPNTSAAAQMLPRFTRSSGETHFEKNAGTTVSIDMMSPVKLTLSSQQVDLETCSGCSHHNLQGSKFCNACGLRLLPGADTPPQLSGSAPAQNEIILNVPKTSFRNLVEQRQAVDVLDSSNSPVAYMKLGNSSKGSHLEVTTELDVEATIGPLDRSKLGSDALVHGARQELYGRFMQTSTGFAVGHHKQTGHAVLVTVKPRNGVLIDIASPSGRVLGSLTDQGNAVSIVVGCGVDQFLIISCGVAACVASEILIDEVIQSAREQPEPLRQAPKEVLKEVPKETPRRATPGTAEWNKELQDLLRRPSKDKQAAGWLGRN